MEQKDKQREVNLELERAAARQRADYALRREQVECIRALLFVLCCCLHV